MKSKKNLQWSKHVGKCIKFSQFDYSSIEIVANYFRINVSGLLYNQNINFVEVPIITSSIHWNGSYSNDSFCINIKADHLKNTSTFSLSAFSVFNVRSYRKKNWSQLDAQIGTNGIICSSRFMCSHLFSMVILNWRQRTENFT